MTILEVVAQLRKELKPYVGKRTPEGESMSPQYFSITLKRIEAAARNQKGGAKACTIATFFREFGYEGSFNEWQKLGAVALS